MTTMAFECALRKAIGRWGMEYYVTIEPISTCGNGGPVGLHVKRFLWDNQTQTLKKDPICQFTFTGDLHGCSLPWKHTEGINFEHKDEVHNCTDPRALAISREAFSDFDPANQTDGHSCKDWYVQTLTAMQALYSVASSVAVGTGEPGTPRYKCIRKD